MGVLSRDGHQAAFRSSCSDLVTADPDDAIDVYARDRLLGVADLASVSGDGVKGNGTSGSFPYNRGVAISRSGRYVVFASSADNLVPGDTNGECDVFVRDRMPARTVRVSVSTANGQADGASSPTFHDVAISADGLTVAFDSTVSNLAPGDKYGQWDVFVRAPCVPQPTATPSPTVTLVPTATATATATPTDSVAPTAAPRPTSMASCVCPTIHRRVPAVVIADTVAKPDSYYGWQLPLSPNKPIGPDNPRRDCLSLRSLNTPYHPMWNSQVWRIGCQKGTQGARPAGRLAAPDPRLPRPRADWLGDLPAEALQEAVEHYGPVWVREGPVDSAWLAGRIVERVRTQPRNG